MTPYALPNKQVLPIGSLEEAKTSWLQVSRLRGLSHGERVLARRRILGSLRTHAGSVADYQFSVNQAGDKVELLRIPVLRKGLLHLKEQEAPKVISDDTFDQIIANHEANTIGFVPYLHVGHYLDGKVDSEGAEGEIVLFERGTGDESFADNDPEVLYAYVEPNNADIVTAVEQKTYRKASIEFFQNFLDRRDGRRKGATVQAVALTNAPSMPDLGDVEVIALSANAAPGDTGDQPLVVLAYNLIGGDDPQFKKETSAVPEVETPTAETVEAVATPEPADVPAAEAPAAEAVEIQAAVPAEEAVAAEPTDAQEPVVAETAEPTDAEIAATMTQGAPPEPEAFSLPVSTVPVAEPFTAAPPAEPVAAEAPSAAESPTDIAKLFEQLNVMKSQMDTLTDELQKANTQNAELQRELVQLSTSASDEFAAVRATYVAKGVSPAMVDGVIALAKGRSEDGLIQLSSGATADPVEAVRAVLDAFPQDNLVELGKQTGVSALEQLSVNATGGHKPYQHVIEKLKPYVKG